jgi:hypothetical protein
MSRADTAGAAIVAAAQYASAVRPAVARWPAAPVAPAPARHSPGRVRPDSSSARSWAHSNPRDTGPRSTDCSTGHTARSSSASSTHRGGAGSGAAPGTKAARSSRDHSRCCGYRGNPCSSSRWPAARSTASVYGAWTVPLPRIGFQPVFPARLIDGRTGVDGNGRWDLAPIRQELLERAARTNHAPRWCREQTNGQAQTKPTLERCVPRSAQPARTEPRTGRKPGTPRGFRDGGWRRSSWPGLAGVVAAFRITKVWPPCPSPVALCRPAVTSGRCESPSSGRL